MSRSIACALLAGLAGCATSRSFEPGEQATAVSPDGYVAADYDMIAEGDRLGEAVVWSDGAHTVDVGEEKRTVVHVGFRVENATDVPLQIDTERVTLHLDEDKRVITASRPIRVEGDDTIPPDDEGELSLYFALPRGVSPREVDAFRVDWRATAGPLEYAQRTPFLEHDPMPAYGPYVGWYYSPFFDPFLYDPFFYPRRLIVHPTPFVHGGRLWVRRR